jgi:hypothetical protein
MKHATAVAIFAAFCLLSACHSKKQSQTEIPPVGYYATRAEAQTFADRLNDDVAKSRAKEKAEGVRAVDLPCAHYVVRSRKDSDGHPWWGIRRDTSGCLPGHTDFPNPLAQPATGGKQP